VLVGSRGEVNARMATRREQIEARLRHRSVDRQIADGADVDTHAIVALRAAALTSPKTRRMVVRALDRLLSHANAQRHGLRRASIDTRHLAALTDEICELRRELLASTPVSATGVALAMVLLTDAGSPLYRTHNTDEARCALVRAIALLAGPASP
jgi:hypothetical protein